MRPLFALPALAAVLLLPGTPGAAPRSSFPPIAPEAALPDGVRFLRSGASTTWVLVGQNCAVEDTAGSPPGQSTAHVWCFEGAGGANTWPAIPPGQNDGSRHTRFDHWSRFAPPEGNPTRWHVTDRHLGAASGSWNAWCGCESTAAIPACEDVEWWAYKDGYGDSWNYPLVLDMSGQDATAGGTVTFDLRYDAECAWDYAALEYLRASDGEWVVVTDGSGKPALFSGVSGNVGSPCGDDYFGHSGTNGGQPYYGNSVWLTGVTFPLPAQAGGMILRWRATSDEAWSDQDGRGDTDGLVAVDNVTVAFTAGAVTVTDDFESGDFGGVTASSGLAVWIPGGLTGNVYDGWHLEFDPKFRNKGNTCDYSNDWMWNAKPAVGAIPANGFDYALVTPVIQVAGWTGGVLEYAAYHCTLDDRNDQIGTVWRVHRAGSGWTPWLPFAEDDALVNAPNCLVFDMNQHRSLTPALGAGVDSLQAGWRIFDRSRPGDLSWGLHTMVAYVIDNVSIGSFDTSEAVISAPTNALFGDTFSRVDPAHSDFLGNSEEGHWIGNGGTRPFAADDSLTVEVVDRDGVASVQLHWRVGSGAPTVWGPWNSKPMVFGTPTAGFAGSGLYRSAIGNTSSEDYSADEAGSLGNPAKDPIWDPGQTVQYYVRAQDFLDNSTFFPAAAAAAAPEYLEWSVLFPMGRMTPAGQRLLLVDDQFAPCLDFANSSGFQPTGGAGFGDFTRPAWARPDRLVGESLAWLFGSGRWDVYRVNGAGSEIQREPRVLADPSQGLGGIADADGTPRYDAVVWIHGSWSRYTYADTTRLQLKSFLDHGGHLLSAGSNVAWDLGAGGNNTDSTIAFLGDYLGVTFPAATDDAASSGVLWVNTASAPQEGYSLYGECPGERLRFDKLTESPDVPGVHTASTFAVYQQSDGATNGRAAVVVNERVGGGVGVQCGFGLTEFRYPWTRACLLRRIFDEKFGIAVLSVPHCYVTDAPFLAPAGFGFELHPPSPTPFTTTTRIAFLVPASRTVSVDIYNVLGEHVRTLARGRMEMGQYEREWDGRDGRGKPVPAGVYFVKMRAGDFTATRKVLRLR